MSTLNEKPQYDTTRPQYERYALEYTSPEPELLRQLTRSTHFASTTPGMLSGHLQGQFLRFVSRMLAPQRILEIGTFSGYSAICLAAGLKPGGELHTIDNNAELSELAASAFRKAGLLDVIRMYTGEALDVIPGINGPFDLVFIDADKENYTRYYESTLPLLRQGGFLIADNVLWYGKVLEKNAAGDKETRGIAEFNEHVRNDDRVEHLLLPVRDGLMMVWKK